MAYAHWERLSALDASFLDFEDRNVHMHVGFVGLFESAPLTDAEGAFDIERVRAWVDSMLWRSPRFRQRLARVPLLDHPAWIDDERFNLDYHVRHTCLPRPGDERQLKRLTGRILSQQLDRGKPLWELWFVEGLEEGRFAIVSKVHHCMVDGIAGVDLISTILRGEPEPAPQAPRTWLPRPAPGGARLLAAELQRRALAPLKALGAGRELLTSPLRTLRSGRDAAVGIGEALAAGLSPASPTPLNPDIGPHRRFDWARFDLAAVKEVKNALGGTLNDVVLATAAGALRHFLRGRGIAVDDLDFRALVPVSVRGADERGRPGNRVSFLLARLPLEQSDPRRRLRRVMQTTAKLKRSRQALGAQVLQQVSDWTADALYTRLARLGAQARSFNTVITNVPGPQAPAYLLGARLLAAYPVVPLFPRQALGIALFSYDGGLFWGFNTDWDAVPDLHDLVLAVEGEFERLRKLATGSAR